MKEDVMKIAALIKQVPDTETKIVINGTQTGIEDSNVKFVMSPYDEFGVEQAIKTKEANAGSETYVISCGPQKSVEALRTALAMGIDKAIHINTDGATLDSFTTAKALAKALGDKQFDVIFCGKQAIDNDNGQVVSMIGELLNIPQVTIVEGLELSEGQAKVTRRTSGGAKEVYQTKLPAIFGCEKGLNTPRYASLPGIMKAKSKPVETLALNDVLEGATPLVEFTNYRLPPEKAAGKMIDGEPQAQAHELVRLLREEAKVI